MLLVSPHLALLFLCSSPKCSLPFGIPAFWIYTCLAWGHRKTGLKGPLLFIHTELLNLLCKAVCLDSWYFLLFSTLLLPICPCTATPPTGCIIPDTFALKWCRKIDLYCLWFKYQGNFTLKLHQHFCSQTVMHTYVQLATHSRCKVFQYSF